MKPVYVRGLGFWSPGFADTQAWCRNERDPALTVPKVALLTGALHRRSTQVTRMSVEVFHQIAEHSGFDLETVPSVWATAHGEHTTANRLLGMMRKGEGKLSPTHFHNSVHNTPSGYASIATGNCAPSSTLVGGGELVYSGFIEAMGHLEGGADDLALLFFDEPLLPPFDYGEPSAPLALGFGLSRRAEGALGSLSGLRRDAVPASKPSDQFGGLFIAAALPLLERIAQRRPGTVALEFESRTPDPVACIDFELTND